MYTKIASSFLLASTAVHAHMHLNYPATFNASNNPHTTGPSDPFLDYPYGCCGRTTPMPCRGYLDLIELPEGAPVATWAAGSQQNFNITGIGNHYGGSCQVGFSVDKGATFQVATSYEGNCPHRNAGDGPDGQNFNFTIPADIPTGNVIFAWTWINREQEFNMNCAAVTITEEGAPEQPVSSAIAATSTQAATSSTAAAAQPTSSSATYTLEGCTCTCTDSDCTCKCPKPNVARSLVQHKALLQHLEHLKLRDSASVSESQIKRAADSVAYSSRPQMLLADIDNGCESVKTTHELKYPNPGPDVVQGDGEYPLAMPTPANKCGY
ncbi:lytic polysaccharide monooxygenase [Lepidopterella palustris CBS 459.81]|uniref:Lytic polysaccharide monooxygenase n=1 Tax=Lepidopterella palustris CBS 459.81 TaxID=1314670 RepID=A0A8E2JAM6_9PEZI|nr:lytic polysaccharide monooxygenase [Lepidopterella palustris CBS 459.81]